MLMHVLKASFLFFFFLNNEKSLLYNLKPHTLPSLGMLSEVFLLW